jgi:2,3-bisphosphoglycerate-dependent phosphoglycerate mutase
VEIVLVRHAEPAWTSAGLSVSNPPLTDRGRRQARSTANRLAAEPAFDDLLVSPARRSLETAEPIARRLGIEPTVVDDLLEIKGPLTDGLPAEQAERFFTDAHHRPPEEWWQGFDGVEPFMDFRGRVVAALDVLLAARGVTPHADHRLWQSNGDQRRVLIVAHGGTNAVIITHLLGLDPTPWEWERFVSNHASVSRLMLRPLAGAHVFALRSSNGVEHLVPADRTW